MILRKYYHTNRTGTFRLLPSPPRYMGPMWDPCDKTWNTNRHQNFFLD